MSAPDHIKGDDALTTVWSAMNAIAPLSLAETSWDNVGILLQAPAPELNKGGKIILAVDLTTDVVEEVLGDGGAAVLIVYHPIIFRGLKSITLQDSQQRSLLRLAMANISIYCPHTSLDACRDGINDWLIRLCTLDPLVRSTAIQPAKGPPSDHENSGMGRLARLQDGKISITTLVERVKKGTGVTHVQVAKPSNISWDDPTISSIAVCAGSGSSVLNGARSDAYVTGEMSHHEILAYVARGAIVVLTNHSNSERGYLSSVLQRSLQGKISEQGKPYEVCVSRSDRDPLETI
ncbi:hypothetical protein CBS101457_001270 [Exobasidium rhododendri]|nr:hypothetical protein CBS101457_001270 [Exobasidium rhododendri]